MPVTIIRRPKPETPPEAPVAPPKAVKEIRRVYLRQTVWEAAHERIRWLFKEFGHNVVVNVSGGKDSTVIYNIALNVARDMGLLPLKVLFIDQEAEWDSVIQYMRTLMNHPDVEPYWLQIPIRLFNATSQDEPWLFCWQPGKEWIRPKEEISIKKNVYGTDRFAALFGAFGLVHFRNSPMVHIAGVRAEESPSRYMGLTSRETYKGETWGKVRDARRGHYDMYPLYDWTTPDIWKAIHDNGWPYCRIYDYMYQHGVPVKNMRVSNVHHETAVHSLTYLQEVEGATWERITARLKGINTVGHLQESWKRPKKLPWMFKDWWEYRDHLLKHWVTDDKIRAHFKKTFEAYDARYDGKDLEDLVLTQIDAILVNDFEGTKLDTFRACHVTTVNRKRKDAGLW
jgi:predicted phosphoadenosine phosphosulfate sulfurtransferase